MNKSIYGCLSASDEYAERVEKENKHPIRSEFERDRDRIMYSKAFRRLSGKTQVFLAGSDDHARTRLTHTLEVAQIARTITKALGLNEELAEAIALGHDIGHTPFGHVGERMLNSIMSGCYEIGDFNELSDIEKMKGFKHNWQSIRVAAELESSMNLTNYTLWGMLNHSKIKYKKCKMEDKNHNCLFRHERNKMCNVKLEEEESLSFYRNIKIKNVNLYEQIKERWSFEGLIVALSDEVAQRHHDIEDALEYNIIDKNELYEQLDKIFNFNGYRGKIEKEKNLNSFKELLKSIEDHKRNFEDIKESIDNGSLDLYKPKFSKFIVNILTTDIIYNTKNNFSKFVKDYNIKSNEDFYNIKNKIKNYKDIVAYSGFMKETDKKLEEFLRNRILNSHKAQTMDAVGQHIIKELFKAYLISPQQLPDKTIVKLFENLYKEDKEKLDEFKYENSSEYNVGKLRNILSEYHFNRERDEEDEKYEKYEKDKIQYVNYKVELLRTICDYVAGMTDKYTIEQHRRLYNIL